MSIKALNWRYATKRYDSAKKLNKDQLQLIKEALRLAPSSFGLQAWKFIHVTDPKIREELKAAAYGQPQLTEASDIFILSSMVNLTEQHLDQYIQSVADARGISVQDLTEFKNSILNSTTYRSADELKNWLARQVYIPLGVALAIAAENQIDATPMEGFDNKKFDQILGLDQLGLESRAILALGFRSDQDHYQKLNKSRFTEQQVFIQK